MGKMTDEKERGKYYGGETKKEGKIAGVKERGKHCGCKRKWERKGLFRRKYLSLENFTLGTLYKEIF